MIQWLRLCLPSAGDMGSIPDLEDPTCHRAAKPWAMSPHPAATEGLVLSSLCSAARETTIREACRLQGRSSPLSLQREKARM